MCKAFEKCKEVPETVPLDFAEDEVTWVASNIPGVAGALGGETIELINWIIFFKLALEYLRVVVAKMADWVDSSSPS